MKLIPPVLLMSTKRGVEGAVGTEGVVVTVLVGTFESSMLVQRWGKKRVTFWNQKNTGFQLGPRPAPLTQGSKYEMTHSFLAMCAK